MLTKEIKSNVIPVVYCKNKIIHTKCGYVKIK